MVRALLENRKTQTRRMVKPQPLEGTAPEVGVYHPVRAHRRTGQTYPGLETFGAFAEDQDWPCLYGKPGDRLWVRETFCLDHMDTTNPEHVIYRADDNRGVEDLCEAVWKPSIFMPRWASRITLEIVSLRVERLCDISEEDAKAEGVEEPSSSAKLALICPWGNRYRMLWNSINGPGSWNANPWVWVIEFKRTIKLLP